MTAISQRSFARGELSEEMHGRADLGSYQNGLSLCENAIILKQGGWTVRGGTRFVREVMESGRKGRLVPFGYKNGRGLQIEFGHQRVRFHTAGGTIETSPGVPYEIASPYTEAMLPDLWFVQSRDVLFLCHPQVRTKELQHYGDLAWIFTDYIPDRGPFEDQNQIDGRRVQASAATGTGITLTASGFTFAQGDAGKLVRLEQSDWSAIPLWVGNKAVTPGDQVTVYGHVYKVVSGTNTGVNPPTHTEGDQKSEAGSGGVVWRYLHDGYGIAMLVSIAPDGKTATADVVSYLPDQIVSTPTPRWALSPWSDADGWPAMAGFHQDRLLLLADDMIWASETGNYNGHEAGDLASSALVLRLANREQNPISWMASGPVLAVGTLSEEWTIEGGGNDPILQPDNRRGVSRTAEGSARIPALAIDSTAVFVSASRDRLHEFAYSFQTDNYKADDLSILAHHITAPLVAQIVWDRDPLRVIWARMDDGSLAGMTYRRDQDVAAWHRHPMTNGFVESLSTCRSPDGYSTELWLIVRRVIAGQVRRYIEVMQKPFTPAPGVKDATHAWQLDCALRYEGAPATLVSGLEHLEGELVSILADGKVQTPKTVTAGKITLDSAASVVLAGLPFVARGRTLGLDYDSSSGAMTGRKVKVSSVTLRILKSAGGQAGTPGNLRPLDDDAPIVMDRAPQLRSTKVRVTPWGDWVEEGMVEWAQDQPLPLTVLSVTPEFDVED